MLIKFHENKSESCPLKYTVLCRSCTSFTLVDVWRWIVTLRDERLNLTSAHIRVMYVLWICRKMRRGECVWGRCYCTAGCYFLSTVINLDIKLNLSILPKWFPNSYFYNLQLNQNQHLGEMLHIVFVQSNTNMLMINYDVLEQILCEDELRKSGLSVYL